MTEPQQETKNAGNGKKRILMIISVITSAGLIGGGFYSQYRKTHISTDDAFVDGTVLTVAAKISGTVKTVTVTDNQYVKAGDLLVELDPADYNVRHQEAVSAVQAEKAKLNEAQTRIAAANANLELQLANLKLAEIEKARCERLFQKEVLARDKYDRAMTNHEVAVAQVKAAEVQMQNAESQKLTQLSTVRQKEASAEITKLSTRYTKIYSPAAGYVTKKTVQVGNQIQAGQPLMAVVHLDDLWIVANYKETQIRGIRVGQKVEIKVDALDDGIVFSGKVDSLLAGTGAVFSFFPPENATGNFVKVVQRIPVKITLDKSSHSGQLLRMGMSVVPTILAE